MERILIPAGSYVYELNLVLHDHTLIDKCSQVVLYSSVLDSKTAEHASSILKLLKSSDAPYFNTGVLSEDQIRFLRQNLTDKFNGARVVSYTLLRFEGNVVVVD